jgi:6-phosphogluconolactonase
MASSGGSLYTQTNDPNGNTVQRFDRAPDGSLTPAGTFATGGIGLAGLAAGRAPSS